MFLKILFEENKEDLEEYEDSEYAGDIRAIVIAHRFS